MIKKGLKVKIICGKDKNKEGEIIELDRVNNRAKVKGANIIKKHVKTTKEKKGGIFEKEKIKLFRKYSDQELIESFNSIMRRYSHLNARAIEVDSLKKEINKRFDVSGVPDVMNKKNRYSKYSIYLKNNKIYKERESFNIRLSQEEIDLLQENLIKCVKWDGVDELIQNIHSQNIKQNIDDSDLDEQATDFFEKWSKKIIKLLLSE